MKFFIDSANLAEIRTAWDLGILDGVTTNPTLIAKEGIKGVQNILNHYKNIFKLKNVDIDFTEDLIDEVVERSIKKGTGARGLHGILEPKLLKIQFDLKKYVNNDKIVIDKKIFDLINL